MESLHGRDYKKEDKTHQYAHETPKSTNDLYVNSLPSKL